MSAAKLPDLRECVGCEVTHEGTELDPKGRCGTCADHQVCGECGEHFIGADGPCPCHAERAELAEARRADDREGRVNRAALLAGLVADLEDQHLHSAARLLAREDFDASDLQAITEDVARCGMRRSEAELYLGILEAFFEDRVDRAIAAWDAWGRNGCLHCGHSALAGDGDYCEECEGERGVVAASNEAAS